MNKAALRQARHTDHAAIRAVCLATGADGLDASDQEDDPDLVGQIFAVPYQVFAPEFSWVLETEDGVRGYVFGVPDTAAFEGWLHGIWFPGLRAGLRDPGPDTALWHGSDWARRHIHAPPPLLHPALAAFPAHGHIDLLADMQGQGQGRRMMALMMDALRHASATGLHLDVSPSNSGARAFYERLGFEPVPVPTAQDNFYVARTLAE